MLPSPVMLPCPIMLPCCTSSTRLLVMIAIAAVQGYVIPVRCSRTSTWICHIPVYRQGYAHSGSDSHMTTLFRSSPSVTCSHKPRGRNRPVASSMYAILQLAEDDLMKIYFSLATPKKRIGQQPILFLVVALPRPNVWLTQITNILS